MSEKRPSYGTDLGWSQAELWMRKGEGQAENGNLGQPGFEPGTWIRW